MIIQAHLVQTISIPEDSQAFTANDIQWMPPGTHTINALNDGEPDELTVTVNQDAARAVISDFQAIMAAAKAGKGDLPYIDFNHADGEASGHPREVYWAGDDPIKGGIRMKLAWTQAGEDAINGKTYRRFSPSFSIDKETGAINGTFTNMGGLVNRAAFRTISPIWSRSSQDQATNQQTKRNNDMSDTNQAVAAKDAEIEKLKAQLAAAQGNTIVQAKDAEIAGLKTRITEMEGKLAVQAREHAKAIVAKAITEGRLAPQATDLHKRWEDLIAVDAKHADFLTQLPTSGIPGTVVTAGAGALPAKPGEHAFVVKARDVETARKVTAAEAFAITARENPVLYTEYRESL